jgi:hypothetical protein
MKLLTSAMLIAAFTTCGQCPAQRDSQQIRATPRPFPTSYTWQDAMVDYERTIQSGSLEYLGYSIYDIATGWALAGYIDQADSLLAKFWNYKTIDPYTFHNLNDGFCVLWALSGKHPANIPFSPTPVSQIVQDNWDGLFYPGRWGPPFLSKIKDTPWTELSGRKLDAKAILLCFDRNTPTHRSSNQNREQAMAAFSKLLLTDSSGYGFFQSGTCAAIVATSLAHKDQAIRFIRFWGHEWLQSPGSLTANSLMKDTGTARYLLDGVLAPVFNITPGSCTADLQHVKSLMEQRIKNGPILVYGQMSLKELLQRLSDSAIADKSNKYDDSVLHSRWLGYSRATAEKIQAAEKHLGVTLPDDYKSFLLLTNGFRRTSSIGITFLPVERIGWLRDMDAELAAVWGEPMDDKDSARAAGFRRSLLIGGLEEEQQFLLVPPGGVDKDWQCWFFGNWIPGIEPYPSLRYFFEKELQQQEDWHKRGL